MSKHHDKADKFEDTEETPTVAETPKERHQPIGPHLKHIGPGYILQSQIRLDHPTRDEVAQDNINWKRAQEAAKSKPVDVNKEHADYLARRDAAEKAAAKK